MKRFFLLCLSVAVATFGFCYERPGFEWSVGAEAVSSYLWRGQNLGSLSLQPDVELGYAGVKLEAWANFSAQDYTFKTFVPEMDITLSYNIAGFTVGVTHLFYFDGSKYFRLRNYGVQDYFNDNYSTSQLEIFGRFDLDYFYENLPLHIFWGTFIGGDDMYAVESDEAHGVSPTDENGNFLELDDEGNPIYYEMKRAYSSYLEVSYDFSLPHNLTLTPIIGITPWKSMYSYYDKNFALNNLALKANWELEIGKHACLDFFAMVSLNTAGINIHNWITPYDVRSDKCGYENPEKYGQRLNGCVGVGIWFY